MLGRKFLRSCPDTSSPLVQPFSRNRGKLKKLPTKFLLFLSQLKSGKIAYSPSRSMVIRNIRQMYYYSIITLLLLNSHNNKRFLVTSEEASNEFRIWWRMGKPRSFSHPGVFLTYICGFFPSSCASQFLLITLQAINALYTIPFCISRSEKEAHLYFQCNKMYVYL